MKKSVFLYIFLILSILIVILIVGCTKNDNNLYNDYYEFNDTSINFSNNTMGINDPKMTKQDMKILVIEINPVLNTVFGNPTVSEYFGQDKEKALSEIIDDLETSSHNYLHISTTREWLNEFPTYNKEITLSNGKKSFRYDEDTFLTRDNYKKNWYDYIYNNYAVPSEYSFDYTYLISKFDLIKRKNNKEFDHVWILSIDPASTYETIMVGRTPIYFNSPGYYADCDNFQLNNISISRRDANLHAFNHGYENLMRAVYNRFKNEYDDYTNLSTYSYYSVDYNSYKKNIIDIDDINKYRALNYWEKFALNIYTNNGQYTGVGNVHFPFNGDSDYDYTNVNNVLSNWQEWENYPNIKGDFKLSNNKAWMNHKINQLIVDDEPDRLYNRFWLYLMPNIVGYNNDGYLNNWWKYYYSLDFVENLFDSLTNGKIKVHVDNYVKIELKKTFHSSKEEIINYIFDDNNVEINNKTVVDFKNGYLYAVSEGETYVTLSYDGKKYNYVIKVIK